MSLTSRINRLVNEALSETAGIGARWPRMSMQERRAFLKRKPNSKYREKLNDPIVEGKGGKAKAGKAKAPASKAPAKKAPSKVRVARIPKGSHEDRIKAYINKLNRAKPAKNPKPISTGTGALKTSNHIIKNFGASRLKNYSPNPYSGIHTVDHHASRANATLLGEHLQKSGWTKDGDSYKHADGGHVVISHHSNPEKPSSVIVYGKKKAKQSNLPYYD